MRINEITTQAVGKWDYIFQSLGIEVGNGKHCPYPVCGGKDIFRFDNKNGAVLIPAIYAVAVMV